MGDPVPRFRKGQQEELADLRQRVRILRRLLAAVAFVAVLGIIVGSAANVQACRSRHAIVSVGSSIIDGPQAEARLRRYFEAGVMSRAQYAQAIKTMHQNLKAWQSADCAFP